MPHLATFAKKYDVIVHDIVNQDFLQDLFHLPLSQQAYNEFLELEKKIHEAREYMERGDHDSWSYIWGSSDFSSKKAYNALVGFQPTIPHFSTI